MDISPRPTVLGTGLSGLAISRALSKAGIKHRLIGPPPSDRPRLGESLDVVGSVDLLEFFGEFSEHYYSKPRLDFWCGDGTVKGFDLRLRESTPAKVLRVAGGFLCPSELLHLDRVNLDQAVFQSAIADENCLYIEALASNVEYDSKTDRVGSVQLDSGRQLQVSHVFDATREDGPVARAAQLHPRQLSTEQRVTFAHFGDNSNTSYDAQLRPWRNATTLVRLLADSDGVDALAWVIPFGKRVSIGINTEATVPNANPEEIISQAANALIARGMLLSDELQQVTPAASRDYHYFAYPRVYGANWILSGPAACQIWFMSGAGVGVGLASAHIAAEATRRPLAAGRRYQAYIQKLTQSNQLLHRFRYDCWWESERQSLPAKIVRSNLKRTAAYCSLRGLRRPALAANVINWLAPLRAHHHYFCYPDKTGISDCASRRSFIRTRAGSRSESEIAASSDSMGHEK